MPLLVDTHVHLYPCYDLTQAFSSAFANFSVHLSKLNIDAASTTCALALTERYDCDFFSSLADGSLGPSEGFKIKSLSDRVIEVSLVSESESKFIPQSIFLLRGYQIVTAERIEVLTLGVSSRLPDKKSLIETLSSAAALGGVTVLPWSPGKWSGERGKLVTASLQSAASGSISIGDIFMRAGVFGEPSQFKLVSGKDLRILCGSDPLPFLGDERLIGRYCSYLAAVESGPSISDVDRALAALRSVPSEPIGERSTLAQSVWRTVRNELSRRLG